MIRFWKPWLQLYYNTVTETVTPLSSMPEAANMVTFKIYNLPQLEEVKTDYKKDHYARKLYNNTRILLG